MSSAISNNVVDQVEEPDQPGSPTEDQSAVGNCEKKHGYIGGKVGR